MNVILDLTAPMLGILLCAGSAVGWLFWRKRNCKFRYWIIPVFVCYALILTKLTIFPIFIFDQETLERIREGAGKYFVFYQIIPFASIKNYFHPETIIQLIGNVMLLAPLVLFVEIISHQRIKAWKEILALSSVSFLIETAQLVINLTTGHPSRVADVDDLILNITGVVFTVILARCIGRWKFIRSGLRKLFYREMKMTANK